MIITSSTPIDRAVALAHLALQFSRIERATRHEDGKRAETDADHSIMLALVAAHFAPPGLNHERIVALATVHDLAEVYAGDTQTLDIDAAGRAAKAAREGAAIRRLTGELGADSWLVQTLHAYEAQEEPEARYVRVMDKLLPKLTHLLNGCIIPPAFVDRATFVAINETQLSTLTEYLREDPWAPEVLELLRTSMRAAENSWPVEPVPVP